MSLKNAVILVMGLTILLIVGLSAAVLIPQTRSFAQLEEAKAREDGKRVKAAIAGELAHLQRTAIDWSNWDDTYAFIAGEPSTFVEDNLSFATMSNLDVNVMLLYDRQGHIAWGKMFDLESEQELALSQFAPGALAPDDLLLAGTGRDSATAGLLATDAGPMLVVSSPIVPTEDTAPAAGTLVIGRLLDRAKMEPIGQMVSVDFDITVAGQEADAIAQGGDMDGSPTILETDSDTITGRTLLPDVYGTPALTLTSRTARDVTAVGNRSVQLSLLSLLVIGLVDIVLMWFLLQRLVLRRVAHLTKHVELVTSSGLADARVPVQGKDELAVLARAFNRMLDSLAEARRQLVEQSHRAGMSEMAAGVLHNLRNGLAPLVGRLEALGDRLRSTAGSEVGRAVEELADPATEEPRRRRLLEYIAATGASVGAAKEEAVTELTALTSHARKLGEIVKYQDKFIYGGSALQPTEIRGAIVDAIRLLPQRLRASLTVTIDPGIDRLPAGMAERIALIQIFHNLLLNAAETVGRHDGVGGEVTISGTIPPGNAGMVEIAVADNGIGIESEQLPKIFARGYTTKPDGAGGLGLHWCANAAANMQGRLRATSAGRGKGATFYLMLPAAQGKLAA